MYFGDSENDNPVFRLADVSIGIVTSKDKNSSRRVKPSLVCKYYLDYHELPRFLTKLSQNNFEFHEALLNSTLTRFANYVVEIGL